METAAGVWTGVGVALFFDARCVAGEADVAGLATGEEVATAVSFFRLRFGFGDSAGDALVSATPSVVASRFFSRWCLAGVAEASGAGLSSVVTDCARTTPENVNETAVRKIR